MAAMPGQRDEHSEAQGALNVRESFEQPGVQFEEGHERPVDFLETDRFQVGGGQWKVLKKDGKHSENNKGEYPVQNPGGRRDSFLCHAKKFGVYSQSKQRKGFIEPLRS